MVKHQPFKWRHFEAEIILLCVRWYLRYALSYRDLEELMAERGLSVDHPTISRWVQQYASELEKGCRSHLKATPDSWKVDQTSIKVRTNWMYLYRAVDSEGNAPSVLLSPTHDAFGGLGIARQSAARRHGVFRFSSASGRRAGGPAPGFG